jgi:hypothetical protein
MSLQSYAIYFYTSRLQTLYKVLCCRHFGAGRVNVVVIVVELDSGIIKRCGFESNWDIFWTNLEYSAWQNADFGGQTYGVVKYIRSIGAIVIESFINNIPRVALPFIVGHLILNMIFQDCNESCIGPRSRGD